MLLKDIIIFILVAYIVSRIIRFLLPIFRISSAAHGHIRNMQEQMQEQMKNMQNQPNQNNTASKRKVEKEGDYIDYEEVK